MKSDAIIHLRVPAATKAAWVHASQERGMKLTDWITEQIEGVKMTYRYTTGLECFVGRTIKMVKVECAIAADDVKLQAVSGRDFGSFGGRYCATITRKQWEDRPYDAYDDLREAIWALGKVGLTPAALEA